MINKQLATYVAFAVFLVLLIAGINLMIAVGPSFDPPEKHTTVVEVSKGAGTGKRTNSIARDHEPPKKSNKKSVTTTLEKPTGAPSAKRTTTTEEGSRSFLERALGESGLIGLQVAIVVLASFLAAALVQKALVGDFSIKVGNLIELAAVGDAAASPIIALTAEVTDLAKASKEHKEKLEALSKLVQEGNVGSAELARKIAELQNQGAELRARIATL